MAQSTLTLLHTDPEHSLFRGDIGGLVAICHENERPPLGLLGQMDWHLKGEISKMIRQGFLTGKKGECVYLPTIRSERVLHLLIVGGGMNPDPGSRQGLGQESISLLKKNIKSLGIEKIGLSLQDFAENSEDYFEKEFKGMPVCIVN
jgi:hypothetical protein